MSDIKFVGLHAHSLSLGDSIGFPKDHFDYVLENGGDGLAITDHGTAAAFGYIFQAKNEFKKKGIKFKNVLGIEAYYYPDLDEWAKFKAEKDEEKESEGLVVEVEGDSKEKLYWSDPIKRRHHLVILVQNIEGYHNLCRIVTESYRKGFYRYPRTDLKTLEKYNKGLIISSACIAGIPSWSVLQNWEKGDEAVYASLDKEFKPLLDVFGKERANIEIQFNKLAEQKLCNEYLIEYSKKTGYPLVATADSHYSRPEHWREREIYKMLAQQSKGYEVDATKIPKAIDELKCELFPKSGNQMFESYCEMYDGENNEELDSIVLGAIERSYKIAHEQIDDVNPDTSMKLPKAFLKGADPDERLSQLCNQKLKELNPEDFSKYQNRLNVELGIITKKKFSLYFLALKECFDKIKEKLLVGSGRGSAVGSLVCYLLNITMVDPIKHGLLFERFLSEERDGAPDCDSDCESRDETIQILKDTFGTDNVISISNFNSLQLKSLVKDISKLYNLPFEEVNAVTSVMEDEARQSILDLVGNDQKLYVFDYDGAYQFSPTFKKFIDNHPQVAESVKVLFKQLKAIGRHAGGIVISENPEENMPIIRIRGEDQTPWGEGLTAKHLEPMGFIKYDFLGIATLRVVRRCIERILFKSGIEVSSASVRKWFEENMRPDVLDEGNEDVFKEIYHKGKFCGIFQFSERAVQEFCKTAKPVSVSDVAVLTALFRPGPLSGKADKKYLNLIENPEDVDFYHPVIKEVLGESKSLLIFQEQFMLLAHKLAGFSLVESDELRKLLVKPVTSLGEQMKVKRLEVGQKFIDGCVASGIKKERAGKLWNDEILPFISYGFNKCLHKDDLVAVYSEIGGNPVNKTIENVQIGDFLKSRDENTNSEIFVRVVDKHDHGILELYEAKLESGEKIRCTMNHKFRTKDGKMLPLYQITIEDLDIATHLSAAKVVEITPIGRHQTYDLEVNHKDHQFYLANGVLTSNSHAVAYAYLSYQCAHLFYHYPEEWICSYLENDPNKDAATAEVEALGYKIAQLDILSSGREYSISGNMVYPPFSSVKGIGQAAIDELLETRKNWTKTDNPISNFETFFWDVEQSQLKNGAIRSKRSWKFTKFNKRALMALVQLEALGGLGLVPELFRNHAHMYRVFEKYWNQRDKQKFDLLAACSDEEISTEDFSDAERVTAQQALVGTYDKDLLITSDVIDFLREQDIMPLEDLSEHPIKTWFILKDFSMETTKNKKEYSKLVIGDVVGKEMVLNYFFLPPREGWKVNSVYWAELFKNGSWINVKRGSFIKSLD